MRFGSTNLDHIAIVESYFFFKVHMFSYQCSQLSTPESVIEVFNTAKKFQEDQKNTKFTSVVVLDEVGLAEDSPNLPLKALHPLLEDGTEGTEDQQVSYVITIFISVLPLESISVEVSRLLFCLC